MSSQTLLYRVQWGDTDAAGIVFYPNYFRWFDHAGHEFLRRVGLPVEMLMRQYQTALPIIEVGCRFHQPVRYNDSLTIETAITEVRTRSFRFEHRVSRDGAITGIGFDVRVWTRPTGEKNDTFELAAIPDEVRAHLL